MLDAERRYDPGRGVPFGAYCWRVCILAIHRAVHKARAPVSASHRMDVLRGLRGVETIRRSDEGDDGVEERAEVARSSRVPTPGVAVEQHLRAERIRARIAALVGEGNVPFAVGVLGGEWKPREIAAQHALDVVEVYRARYAVARTLAQDAELRTLYEERTDD